MSRGWLGVKIQNIDEDIAGSLGLKEPKGALVSEVTADGPAADAGLKVEDAILSVNGKPIDDSRDLARKIADLPANTTVDVKVLRDKAGADGQGQARHVPERRGHRAKATAEPEEPKDLGGNVEPEAARPQRSKPAPRQGRRRRHLRRRRRTRTPRQKGIKAGDVILEVGSETVTTPEDVANGRQEGHRTTGRTAVLFHIKKCGDQTRARRRSRSARAELRPDA